ncbi:hypothetical protein [Erythrobacter sp. MTPC3]|uniref:hypothetical protein n=1 Tax=Erythrobacter sp. MTPC3 TaxID=3056564 RepID=UPI0036F2A61F
MTTNTKKSTLIYRALGAAMLLAMPVNAVASDDSDDIVVRSQPAMEKWQKATARQLNRVLERTGHTYRGRPDNAIVQVTFTLGPDGRAKDLQFYNDEGNQYARHVAVRAVRRLRDLNQVPVSDPQDIEFLANIIFADNKLIEGRLMERLVSMERARFASSGEKQKYIALGY